MVLVGLLEHKEAKSLTVNRDSRAVPCFVALGV